MASAHYNFTLNMYTTGFKKINMPLQTMS